MKTLTILSDKKTSLRRKSAEIKFPLEKYVLDLGRKLREHLINSQDEKFLEKHPNVRSGVGIAAPQVGKNIRMFAVLCEHGETELYDYVLLNPKITKKSSEMCYILGGEGCLSVNEEHVGFVPRHHRITISGFDLFLEKEIELTLEGFPSVVFQHEYDHLDGILFYDRINKENPTKEIDGAIVI